LAGGLAERVRQQFTADRVEATPAAVAAAVRREPAAAVLGDTTVLRLADQVHDQLAGAGPLAPLLTDPAVTDVLVNGVEVWIDRGAGLQRAPVRIGDADDVRRLAQRLAAGCGRRLDDGQPYADARLPDGTRLHAVLPPVATTGPYLSLRTFRQRPFTLDDMVRRGAVPPAVAPVLTAIVVARLAYLVTGGTGSGKTTMLGTLLGLVPPTERIVLVEDAAELRPVHPHVVALQARTSNVEGAGAVGLTDLVRQALRMRPDRLVVGECRGAEIVDLLGALNTGHDGGAGTLHANTPADVPARLEALGMLGGLPRAALHAQVLAALQVILQVRRTDAGRVLESISVLLPSGHDRLATVVPAWQRVSGPGPAAEALARMIAGRGHPVPAILTGPVAPGSGRAGVRPPEPPRGAVQPRAQSRQTSGAAAERRAPGYAWADLVEPGAATPAGGLR
jgi:pilus assembly protein CpaF